MFYMTIYFAKGNLPWNSIPYTLNSENYKKENKICQVIKTGISEEILCKDLFKDLVFIKQLVFSNKPQHDLIKQNFESILGRKEYESREFDWDKISDMKYLKRQVKIEAKILQKSL